VLESGEERDRFAEVECRVTQKCTHAAWCFSYYRWVPSLKLISVSIFPRLNVVDCEPGKSLLKPYMQLKELLDGFMRVQRRSEKASPEVLRKTFVDVGPLTALLSISDNQTLFGRRGTGKTHVLQFLGSKQRESGDLAVYIDLSNLGSSGSIYSDTARSIPERATRLLVDTLLAVHDGLLEVVLASDDLDLSQFGPVLDELQKAATRIQVVGKVETEAQSVREETENNTTKSLFGLSEKGLNLQKNVGNSTQETQKQQFRKKLTGVETFVLHFGEISAALRNLEKLLGKRRVWVLLDEWSNLPLELQPYLGDLIRRTFFVMQNVTVKIAAIEYRSRFMVSGENRSYLGIELGADVATNVNLDDFMVFDNDVQQSTKFHRQLLYNHLLEAGDLVAADVPDSFELIRLCFTQDFVFSELVRAGEGVPRDFINILSLAAQYSNNEKITMNAVRKAALSWYQTGKANTLRAKEDAHKILDWIIEKVIRHRKTRAFLVNTKARYLLLDELFDARVVHVIKRRVSSNDLPGERFDVFKLDYGCYVDLIGTASAPEGLFVAEVKEGTASLVTVPSDDYRSIRRAILDFNEFTKHSQATAATS
jgi:hypothetical protein